MTSYDVEHKLEKAGFKHDTKLTYKLNDCRVFLHDEKVSVSDGMTKIVNIPLSTILMFAIDEVAMLLFVETDYLYTSFIIF